MHVGLPIVIAFFGMFRDFINKAAGDGLKINPKQHGWIYKVEDSANVAGTKYWADRNVCATF